MDQTLQDAERAYWEQRLGADVPLNSVGYHGLSDAYVTWLYRIRARRFTKLVRPIARPTMRVLDIGSGGGFYVDLWRRLGVTNITAADLTQASLTAIAKRFPSVTTRRFDVGDPHLDSDLGTFDAISCMDVVHHLMDDSQYAQAMQNCARLLAPGGTLIFTDNFLHWGEYRGPHSVSRSLSKIEAYLNEAGFDVAARRPMFVLMNNPIDSRSEIFRFYWKLVGFASENALLGALIGALLYPLETVLTSLLPEGPSTEICVAQRRR
jgi:2-polyprenyl-3-methyl-5-hydroxy-6-metoxy-1,4-benzoquinol methylase